MSYDKLQADILAARDRREKLTAEAVSSTRETVVIASLNIPGAEKCPPGALRVFGAAVGWMMRLPIDSIPVLLIAGALCSVCGTSGDLVVSSIKRDVGIKDMSAALPGHGGILDRFDSLLLAAPCLYYFILWTHKFNSIQEMPLVSGA